MHKTIAANCTIDFKEYSTFGKTERLLLVLRVVLQRLIPSNRVTEWRLRPGESAPIMR